MARYGKYTTKGQQRDAILYNNGNVIYQSIGPMIGDFGFDTDAVFKIGDSEYTLSGKDFHDLLDAGLINQDGSLKSYKEKNKALDDVGLFGTFEGSGPLGGSTVKTNNGRVCVIFNNTAYPLEDIMSGKLVVEQDNSRQFVIKTSTNS